MVYTDMGRDVTTTNDKALPNEVITLSLRTPAHDFESGTTSIGGFIAFLFNVAGSADILLYNPRLRIVPNEPLLT